MSPILRRLFAALLPCFLVAAALLSRAVPLSAAPLWIEADAAAGTISVFREGSDGPILTQNARPDHRPYLHPIVAPDGKGLLTEYSPGHHKHQTGIYWGFTRVNGRDYFHHPEGTYWRRVDAKPLPAVAAKAGVRWQTVYDLLDANGNAVLRETQNWRMRDVDGKYHLDLEWSGEAKTDVTIGRYDYGGLFLRMPWKKGIAGEVVNGNRQRGPRAEGQRSVWCDVGMQVPGRENLGREDLAHIAVFDHPKNAGFPQPWRVDGQLGVGPVRARLGDWKIAKGKRETIRHRLFVYTGELNDVEVTKAWSEYTGQGGTWAQWGQAQREGREAKFLSPDEAVKAMTIDDELSVDVWASEPMITQPMAFCWDDRGRMWIAENRDYESRGRGFANSGDSRILIIEDTDGDGKADSRKVFSEGIPFPAGIAVGMGGVWLGAPPNLLFLPDRDGDDVADKGIEVRLTGWGIRDRHETLNSFHWGPDGWLYGCQGFATPSKVGKPKGKGRIYKHKDKFPEEKDYGIDGEPIDINGGIWRYHPTKDRFEVVAHGFSNPWGIDYDAKGQLFISACVIPHLWHVIPGGIYHRQGGRHFNPYVYSDIRTITDHRHRSAHGGARVYLSDAFPRRHHGRIFMANIHEHAVLTDILEPKGSGFVGHHGDDVLLANNAQWIGFSMEIGPEGGVYVLDWHDADICGKDVHQKETGRVFRIMPKNSGARNFKGRYADLAKMSDLELAKMQHVASAWHARRARVILQERGAKGAIDEEAVAKLDETFHLHPNQDWRLRAMWALHVAGELSFADQLVALSDRDAHIRAWAVQILCEDFDPGTHALKRFEGMAASDESPVVRLYLAAALQRIPEAARWAIASGLVTHAGDSGDHNIPKMIWFGIEPLCAGDPERALEFAAASRISMVTRFVARRLADEGELEPLARALTKERTRREFLEGLRDGLEGRKNAKAPASWKRAYDMLKTSPDADVRRLALELAQRFGDLSAGQRLFATLKEERTPVAERRRALKELASQKWPALEGEFVTLIGNADLRRDAIRAMAAYDSKELTKALLAGYSKWNVDEKLEAIHTLAARPASGWELAQAIKSGAVPRRDVPAYVARQLRRVVGSGFVEIWGPIDAASAEKEATFKKYRELLSTEALAKANASHGRAVFQRTCSQCHRLYGEGGMIAPDITGANRGDMNYLLGNILSPSDVIQDDYKMLMVLTDEGRFYSGILAGENERQIQLRVVGENEPVSIDKSAIQSREVAPVSMMPEGLLRNISDREVLDLVKYLRTVRQVPMPKAAGD